MNITSRQSQIRARAATRQFYRLFLLSLAFLLMAAAFAAALDVPQLRGRVNDYANVMSPEQARGLETRLAQFEQETGHQVAVLTIPTLDGEDIEGFSIRVAESWKIGKKGFDNGVILVVAIKDRRLRLEVGYGLEGVLPDATVKQITSTYIVPHFRNRDYAGGILAGTDAVLKVIKNEPLPESARKKERGQGSGINSTLMFAITLAVFGLMAFASAGRRGRNSMWATRGRHGGPIIFGPGGFGGYSGGGGFGGGSDGGGFSGGGGSFGGGGASDSW